MHRMFRLDTESGSYALKLLNPEILKRPDARSNYRRAEKLEKQLAEIFLSGFMGCIASCGKALAHGETQIAVTGGCIQLDQVVLIFIHYCGCLVYESQYCCFVHSSLSLITAGSDG